MSWWNPIDAAKSLVHDVENLAHDAVEAGKKLAEDALHTGEHIVEAAVKIGGDIIETGEKVVDDVSHGEIGHAFEDAGKGIVKTGSDIITAEVTVAGDIGHAVVDTAQEAWKLGGDLNHVVVDAADTVAPGAGQALRVGEVFVESAINSAVLTPIDGISQLTSWAVKKTTGYDLPTLHLELKPDTEGLGVVGQIAEMTGSAAGFIAPFLLTGGVTGALGIGVKAVDAAVVAVDAAEAASGVARVAGAVRTAETLVEGASTVTKATEAASTVAKATEAGSTVTQTAEAASTAAKATEAVSEAATFARTSEQVVQAANTGEKVMQATRWKGAMDGAISGFLFTPTDPNGNIIEDRLKVAAISGLTFGAQGLASEGIEAAASSMIKKYAANRALQTGETIAAEAIAQQGSNAAVQVARTLAVNAGGGVVGGFVSAESTALLNNGRFATASELGDSMGQFALVGTALGGAHMVGGRIIEAAKARGGGGVSESAPPPAEAVPGERSNVRNIREPQTDFSPESVSRSESEMRASEERSLAAAAKLGEGSGKLSPEAARIIEAQAMSSPTLIESFNRRFEALNQEWTSTESTLNRARDTEYTAHERLGSAKPVYERVRDEVIDQLGNKALPEGVTKQTLMDSPVALQAFLKQHGESYGIREVRDNTEIVGEFIERRQQFAEAHKTTNGMLEERQGQLQEMVDQFTREHGLPDVNVRITDTLRSADGDYLDGNLRISRTTFLDTAANEKAGTLYHELTHHEQQTLIVRRLADQLNLGAETSAAEKAQLVEHYKRTVGDDIKPEFVESVLKSRQGERLNETQTSAAEDLTNSWHRSQRFNQLEMQQVESELAKIRNSVTKLRGEGGTAETRRILQSFMLDSTAVDRLVSPDNPNFDRLLELQKQVRKEGMPKTIEALNESNAVIQDALIQEGISAAGRKNAIRDRYTNSAHEQIAFNLEGRVNTESTVAPRRGLEIYEEGRKAGLDKYIDEAATTRDTGDRAARLPKVNETILDERIKQVQALMRSPEVGSKFYNKVMETLGSTPSERWEAISRMGERDRQKLQDLAHIESDRMADPPRLRDLLRSFRESYKHEPEFYDTEGGKSDLVWEQRYGSIARVEKIEERLRQIQIERRKIDPEAAKDRWAEVSRIADEAGQGAETITRTEIADVLSHFKEEDIPAVIEHLTKRQGMLSPAALEQHFGEIARSLRDEGFLTEKNYRGTPMDSVKVVTFDPAGSETAYAYLLGKYTGLNVEVIHARSAADMPPEGTKFLVLGDPPVGSSLEDVVLQREYENEAKMEMPAIDREIHLLDFAQSPEATAQKLARRLNLEVKPEASKASQEQIDRVSEIVGNDNPDAAKTFMMLELAGKKGAEVEGQAIHRVSLSRFQEQLKTLNEAIEERLGGKEDVIYVSGADVDIHGGAGSSSLISNLYRRAANMTGSEYDGQFKSWKEFKQAAANGELQGKKIVFLDDASYTGKQVKGIADNVAKIAGKPPQFDYLFGFHGVYREGHAVMEDAGIPHVETVGYLNLPSKAKVRLSGTPTSAGAEEVNLVPFYSVPNNTNQILHDLLVSMGMPKSRALDFRSGAGAEFAPESAPLTVKGMRNLGRVSLGKDAPGSLMRSGTPTVEGLEALKNSEGLDVIIDLTQQHTSSERHWASENDVEYLHHPLTTAKEANGMAEPITQESLDELAELIDLYVREGKRVLVHCAHGRDRTGAVIANYEKRYLSSGDPATDAQRAVAGMERHGFTQNQQAGDQYDRLRQLIATPLAQ